MLKNPLDITELDIAQLNLDNVSKAETLAELVSLGAKALLKLQSLISEGDLNANSLISGLSLAPQIKTVAMYTGSFDPLTLGHRDIIVRASKLFDQVIVGVGVNSDKKGMFTPEERVALIQRDLADLGDAVKVVSFYGAAIDRARIEGASFIIRGVRETTDFIFETKIALINREQSRGAIETFFMPSDPNLAIVSSSTAKELVKLDLDTAKYLSRFTAKELQRKIFEPVLKEFWKSACLDLCIAEQGLADFEFTKLIDAYCGDDRYYHDIRHIHRMLKALSEFNLPIKDRSIFIMAIFYHDFVYDGKSNQNEILSDQAGVEFLKSNNIDNARIENFSSLVLATQKHENKSGDQDVALFLDLDLAILAIDNERYRRYCQEIRCEYSQFTDQEFRAGRSKFLGTFIERGTYFSYPDLLGISDAAALVNLRWEMGELLANS